jgi:hypothetical protein
MGSRPRLVAESFSRLPGALNTCEISKTARRGGAFNGHELWLNGLQQLSEAERKKGI